MSLITKHAKWLSLTLVLASYAHATPWVELYMTDWCPACEKTEAFLKSRNIRYKALDIEKDSRAREKYNELGYRGIPVLKRGRKVIYGFKPLEIAEAFERR